MHIEVYTDGSATTKDKPGGWGWVHVIDGKKVAESNGHMENASNNDAELEAAVQGLAATLKYIKSIEGHVHSSDDEFTDAEVTLVSDSQLILGWASGTYRFKQQDKLEKFKQLQFLVSRLDVKTRWVRGHDGDEHNERCDKLANEARLNLNKKQEREEALSSGKTLIGNKKKGTLCVWYKNCLKIIDLEENLIENYDREVHGPRGGVLEIREDKAR